jgi:hypothetical protein
MIRHLDAVEALELTLLLNDLLHHFAGLDSMPGRARGPLSGIRRSVELGGGARLTLEAPRPLAEKIAVGAMGAASEGLAEEALDDFCLYVAKHLLGWLRAAPGQRKYGEGVEALLEIDGLLLKASLWTPAATAAA